MTELTKKKIEAMAESRLKMYPELDQNYFRNGIAEGVWIGSKPWAEWCERFEKKLKRLKQINIPINVYDRRQMIDEILKEYRQWLEEK